MAEESYQEKTENPTEKKRQEVRESGQVAYSKDVSGALVMLSASIAIIFGGYYIADLFLVMLDRTFRSISTGDFSITSVAQIISYTSFEAVVVVGVFLCGLFFIGLATGVSQIGFRITLKTLAPKFNKINPLTGFQRIFSFNNLNESLKIFLKLFIIGYVIYSVLINQIGFIAKYQNTAYQVFLTEFFSLLSEMLIKLALAFSFIAGLDYFWQRFNFERQIKMTKQEYKEELRQTEGDPLIKARIRSIQQKMSRARMLQDVPTADVVITNPTHYAVVLRYDAEVMSSPLVVAKGLDHLALRIIEIAKKAKVVITRNPAVARGLYDVVEVGDSVPEDFYQIIAEILASAYRLKGINPDQPA